MKPIATRASRMRIRRGFTLIELMVVIALTAILLTLVFKPLTDAWNLSSRASTQIDSQVNARDTMRDVTNLLSNAMFVYDNIQTPINIWVRLRDPNDQVAIPTRFCMVEYVLPARQLDQQPGGEIDPTTGQRIYGDALTPGQRGYALPLAPGRTFGRIFPGLMRNASVNGMPQVPYFNDFEDISVGSDEDNRYILWKTEATAYIPDPDQPSNQPVRYVPNLGLFHTYQPNTDPNNPTNWTFDKAHPIQLHDPNFFYDSSLAGGNGDRKWAVPGWIDRNGDGRVQLWENWRSVATPLLPINRADAIALTRDPDTNNIIYYLANGDVDTNNTADARPQVRPLITFTPEFVQNDMAGATVLNNAGNEAPNPAPTLFRSQYTHWSTPFRVIVYRADPLNPNTPTLTRNPLDVFVADGSGKIGHSTVARNATVSDPVNDVGPGLDATGRFFTNVNPQFAFAVDAVRGTVKFDFPSSALLYQRDANNNMVGVPAEFSPEEVNNGYFVTLPNGDQVLKRFLDLRILPQTTWNSRPLNAGLISPVAMSRPYYSTVSIVPGSERVVGPDQNPGPNYGYPVVYRRVSGMAGMIGKNEYKINYQDVPNGAVNPNHPSLRLGFIEFNSFPDGSNDQQSYNMPQISAITGDAFVEDPSGIRGFGRKYKPNGIPHLRVNRSTGQNEPVEPIQVTFDFQMNHPKDVVKVDYMTRELMNVALEARLYDPRTNAAQATALTQKVKVRNLQR